MESVDPAPADLAAIERARLRAIVDADGPVLWALHDPEFVLCSPGGGIWDRERYVGGLCDGSVSYTRFEAVTPIEVLQSGDLAVVRYRSVIDLTTPQGGGHLECWHVDTYVREAEAGALLHRRRALPALPLTAGATSRAEGPGPASTKARLL